MIFALATDDLSLHAFSSEAAATAYCEAIDVEAAGWLFWDDRGWPLEARFIVPNKRGFFGTGNGVYELVPSAVDRHPHLLETLKGIATVEIAAPLNTVPAIRNYLRYAK